MENLRAIRLLQSEFASLFGLKILDEMDRRERLSYLNVIFAGGLQTLAVESAADAHTRISAVVGPRSSGTTRSTCWTPIRPGAGPA